MLVFNILRCFVWSLQGTDCAGRALACLFRISAHAPSNGVPATPFGHEHALKRKILRQVALLRRVLPPGEKCGLAAIVMPIPYERSDGWTGKIYRVASDKVLKINGLSSCIQRPGEKYGPATCTATADCRVPDQPLASPFKSPGFPALDCRYRAHPVARSARSQQYRPWLRPPAVRTPAASR